MPKMIPLSIGDRFGEWTVIGDKFKKQPGSARFRWYAPVRCSCGATKDVLVSNLATKRSTACKSCSRRTHNMRGTAEYIAWQNMLRRCYDSFSDNYHYYGGRGVTVCDRWNPVKGGGFENFYKDVGPKPSKDHQLDKEAVVLGNKTYAPGLVKWVTRNENLTNRRNTIYVTFNGATMPLSLLAKKLKITHKDLYRYVVMLGRTPEDAVELILNKKV